MNNFISKHWFSLILLAVILYLIYRLLAALQAAGNAVSAAEASILNFLSNPLGSLFGSSTSGVGSEGAAGAGSATN